MKGGVGKKHPYMPHTHTHTSSLTIMYCRSNGDVASLRVKGELVDVHLTGADHPHVLFRSDHPIVGHVHVGIQRGVILLYPETTHTIFSCYVCRDLNYTPFHINHKRI